MNTKIAASLATALLVLSACVTPTDVSLAEKPTKADEATAVARTETNSTTDTAEVPSSTAEPEKVVAEVTVTDSEETKEETLVQSSEVEEAIEETSSTTVTETASEEIPDVPYAAIYEYSWNPEIARAIIMAESSGNPRAVNDNPSTKDYSVGLFQINLFGRLANERPPEDWLKVPENNIQYAYRLYQQSGWRPWSVCRNGAVRCSR